MTSFDRRLRERLAATTVGRLLGIELAPVSNAERLVSALGGFVSILVLVALERDFLGATGAAMLASSMGSTAVLLFAVPHGALSQPWPVLAGHVVSALVGVACTKLFPDPALASALAVGLSIGAMHVIRAIHPPAGATALAAVIGGPEVHALGYAFVVTPVLVNTFVMVLVAVAFNAFFAWRRYPSAWGRKPAATSPASADQLSHADFVAALSRIGTFVDISEEEFLRLRTLMREEADRRRIKPEEIALGRFYSNGAQGTDFAVRWIVDQQAGGKSDGGVIWRVVAGRDRHATGFSSRQEFSDWACCEVARSEAAWVRAPTPGESRPS